MTRGDGEEDLSCGCLATLLVLAALVAILFDDILEVIRG